MNVTTLTFNDLAIAEPLQRALNAEGYTHPTPIQQQAIPRVLKQEDLLACAQTGTGKTAAFALPILQLLTERDHHQKAGPTAGAHMHAAKGHAREIRTLILTPTRELASQIGESFTNYGKGLQLHEPAAPQYCAESAVWRREHGFGPAGGDAPGAPARATSSMSLKAS